MKRFTTLLLTLFLSFAALSLLGQNQPNMYFSGDMNGWGATAMTYRPLGTANWAITIQSTTSRSASGFKFRNSSSDWNNSWGRGDVVSLNTNTTWYHNGGNGLFNEINGKYYTFTWKDVDTTSNTNGFVMETSAQPATITNVTQYPAAANVPDNNRSVTVRVYTNVTPSTEEYFYVRYSTDDWTTSSIVAVSFNASYGSAILPAQSYGTTVSYYVFSTTVLNPVADYDLLTINYDNNGGANYSYTTKYGTAQAGNWNVAATWNTGVVPPDGSDVIIEHAVTVTDAVSSPAVCNDLIITLGSLTVSVGDGLTVSGNLTNDAAATDLTVSSGATGNGSLIVNGTVSGSATVQRYMSGWTSASDGWHLISAPVTNFTISGSDFVPTPGEDDLFKYDETAAAES